jgi:glycosyltransferase involved in cell wall biosynthesis
MVRFGLMLAQMTRINPQICGRVMFFVHDLRASGVVRNTLAIARKVAERHDVLLVSRYDHGFLASEGETDPRWRFESLFPGTTGTQISAIAKLRRLIRQTRPDVVFSTGNRGHWVVRPATFGLERPLRLYRISNNIDRSGHGQAGVRGLGARLLAGDAEKLFLVGRATATAPQFAGAIAAGRADAVPNGVDLAAARQRAAAASPCTWLDGPEPVILSIGRLAPQKDFPTLIRAAAAASRQRPLRLVILGTGDAAARRRLEAVAAKEGFGGRLLLAGETDNVFAWLSRASAFVLPSRWEGSSMALLEALAVGVPVVATWQAGDAGHVLEGGRWGRLVDAGDDRAMAAAILGQLSAQAVLPGPRAESFDAADVLERYAAGVDQAVTRAVRPLARPPARRLATN